jgi:hypothetical protein
MQAGPAGPTSTGPYVAMAVFCQRVDRQADGTVDVIGVIDGLHLNAPEGGVDPKTPPRVRLMAIISIRAGEARGRRTIALAAHFPDGELGATMSRAIELSDRSPGATLNVPLELDARDAGVYWFDVTCDGTLLTRMPLVVQID